MKKILSAIILSATILSQVMPISAISAQVMAVEAVEDSKPNEPTVEEMEEMIKRVRPLIDVPEEYTSFTWNYSAGSVYSSASWRFTWTDDVTGRIRISCDTEGRIFSYSSSLYNTPYAPKLPEKAPSEFEKTAKDFIKKTAPYTKDLSFVLTDTSVGYIYNPQYTYFFTRYENEIPVPDEIICVSVDAMTGEVRSMDVNITNGVEFDKANELIGEEKAKEILSTVQKMNLSYRLREEYDNDGNVTERKAILIYTPELSYVSVDAVTGEIYTQRNTWETIKEEPTVNGTLAYDKEMAAEDSSDSNSGGGSQRYELSEQEQAQLEVLKQLISREQAIKAVTGNDALYIDKQASIVKASLNKNNSGVRPLTVNGEKAEDKYVWNISFTAPETDENAKYYYYHSMNAVVDAKTGELISFSAEVPSSYYYEETGKEIPSLKYDEKQALSIAEDFIAEMQPDKADKVIKSENSGNFVIKYIENDDGTDTKIYGGKRFRFNRVNEGIEFTPNRINVGVEYATGKVYQYNYTWYDDMVFESPKDAISESDALMSLYSYDGFGINYEVNAKYSYNEYMLNENSGELLNYDELYSSVVYTRPVYSAYNLGTTTIRALDGKMIYYSGEEYKDNSGLYSYSDTESHWSKETIERFSYIGFGVDGDKFMPNHASDGQFFASICETIGFYNVDTDVRELTQLTRMDAVKHFIKYLGYEKIALLENVFITDFTDNSNFKKEDVGFAAIARGFGLIEGDGENFRPYETLTRAEAITMAANILDLGLAE